MDGNGRWASKLGQPRTFGHLQGSDNVKTITVEADALGVEVLTLYAFSTENWVRPAKEVSYLMRLPRVFFQKYIDELMEKKVRVTTIGDLSKFPPATAKALQEAKDRTAANDGLILNFAMNYGSRTEILQAVAKAIIEAKAKEDFVLSTEVFESYLDTAGLPPVDLLIRTGGDCRLSNFLLYQLAYSELLFVQETWPEFTPARFRECLREFSKRQRRYGGLVNNA